MVRGCERAEGGGRRKRCARASEAFKLGILVVSYHDHVPVKAKAEARRSIRERRRYARSDNGESEIEDIPHVVRP
jgi:hypothetical protein